MHAITKGKVSISKPLRASMLAKELRWEFHSHEYCMSEPRYVEKPNGPTKHQTDVENLVALLLGRTSRLAVGSGVLHWSLAC